MAIWRLHLVARETAGQDENGWPLTRFVSLSADIEENSVFRLREEARALVRQQVKAPTAIVGMERVDKKTGKHYDWFHDSPEELPVVLDERQQQALSELEDGIWARALGEGEALPQRRSLLICAASYPISPLTEPRRPTEALLMRRSHYWPPSSARERKWS